MNMKFEFSINEVDYIVKCLSMRPWHEVNSLIRKLEAQSNDRKLNPPPVSLPAEPQPH